MDAQELNRQAVISGIPRAIVEKDFALSTALFCISKSSMAGKLVFKGGTALKKIYFPDARFSEDLDFSVLGIDEKELLEGLNSLFANKEIDGIKFATLEKEKTNAGLRAALKFSFILGQPQRIRFDFSFRDNIALKPLEKIITGNGGTGKLLVLPLEELFAEKIHALFGRTTVRDLYDVWFLFKNGIRAKRELIELKFSYYDEKYEPAKLNAKIDDFRHDWKQDLAQFMKKVPEFETVASETVEFLAKTAEI